MTITKMSFCLMLLITIIVIAWAKPSQPGAKIHFQDSSEETELNNDERVGTQQRNHNHRGRTSYTQQNSKNTPQFEQGIPGLYPLKGPPQAPLILPSNNLPDRTDTLVFATQPKANNAVQQPPKIYHYAGNPFLSKYSPVNTVTPATTNKFHPSISTGITNQLPTSDKPLTTTANPRLTNLLHGSNLLEETNRTGKVEDTTTEVNFKDRGLFDTAPHCKAGEILVANKCRRQV